MMSSGRPINGGAKKKKMVIKAYKVKPKPPDNYLETTWRQLEEAIKDVHGSSRQITVGSGVKNFCFESLYKAVEGLCVHKLGTELYTRVEAVCDAHINTMLSDLVGRTPDCVAFLSEMDRCWQEHCAQLHVIRSIFLVLDRKWTIPNAKVVIWEMGMNQFRHYFGQYNEVQQKTVKGLLQMLQIERTGKAVDTMLVKGLLRMLSDLRVYADVFEKDFLLQTDKFYAAETDTKMDEMGVAEYLRHAEARLAEENNRIALYMDPSTRKPLITIVEDRMLKQNLGALLAKGFDRIMSDNHVNDLARMYSLFSRVSGLGKLRSAFSTYVKSAGMQLVNNPERDETMVEELLQFKARMDHLLQNAFDHSKAFAHSLKESCEAFINVRQNKPAELIAKYIDGMLKLGNKGTSEEEVEIKLDQLLVLFRYINGKDVFEAFYKRDLAKRLLLGKSGSTDSEKSMISKLKTECGSQFTNKLEGMFKDIELSKDIMGSFHQSARMKERVGDVDLQVSVLTQVHWPTYPLVQVKLQPQIAEIQDVFKNFYLEKYSGRRLGFLNSLGTCVLRSAFPSGKKEISVSIFQAVVLLLFNETDSLPFSDILAATGIEETSLKRTLQSLACAKVRVLRKKPEGRDVEAHDIFHINHKFQHNKFRIKINQIQMKETVEENVKTTEAVMQDRQYQVDAAIVRIMKTRKTLTHELMVAEVFGQLQFPLRPQDLKKRLESLIDRDYIKRDPKNAK